MESKVLAKSFLWMGLGLVVTFLTGFGVCQSETMLIQIFTNKLYILFTILELVLVVILSARITKLSETSAKVLFLLYAFVSGLTFSSIFVVYEIASILYVFLIAAAMYALMGFVGYTTKCDLTKLGSFALMALVGIIIASIINIFIMNDMVAFIISIISLIVFLGITAYDVQKIKKLSNMNNAAIYGALELYLDFINIFIHLLEIFGKNRD